MWLQGLVCSDGCNQGLHFLFTAGLMGPVQNGLLLGLGHGGVSLHCRPIHGQGQAEADGDVAGIRFVHLLSAAAFGMSSMRLPPGWWDCRIRVIVIRGNFFQRKVATHRITFPPQITYLT